ncbi:MAG: alpha-ketoglutaric semialdehyde dehydrogenase [Verrucomicrobiales bacterium]|jgi:alpha-ketoglutaric semialdehyde dehydrogenase
MNHGQQIIGFSTSAESGETFRAKNPATGEDLPTAFHEATKTEIDRALNLASTAFNDYRGRSAEERAGFLEAIADEIEGLGQQLLETGDAETALGIPRLTAERGRACFTARLFAKMIREGSWVDARIETANPDREPLPKPDVRLMHRPLGPVVVFGASNFPFAISVAGTDTVSALGAGCPVVVKAHPAHPNTCEMIASCIVRAAQKCGMPEGVFSLIHGRTNEVGIALVEHPKTEVVAFTGSLRGGRALFDVAQRRPRPIPVYAEMGSVNPVFILPRALRERGAQIAASYVGSLTLGTGQFCTNPAVVLGLESPELSGFISAAAERAAAVSPATMLHAGIHSAYLSGTEQIAGLEGVEVAGQAPNADPTRAQAASVVFQAKVDRFFEHEAVLKEEVFGPSSVVLECQKVEQMLRFAEGMEGSLSATVHGTAEDLEEFRELLTILETRTGRVIINGFPTGLEVCTAMHHGGPYPAATHSHFTSVGTNAIYRFVRPVCFQDFPDSHLPEELRSANAHGIWRMVNGEMSKEDIVV